jgi:hypothetical protein
MLSKAVRKSGTICRAESCQAGISLAPSHISCISTHGELILVGVEVSEHEQKRRAINGDTFTSSYIEKNTQNHIETCINGVKIRYAYRYLLYKYYDYRTSTSIDMMPTDMII